MNKPEFIREVARKNSRAIKGRIYYCKRALYRCACGKEFETDCQNVTSGNTMSCGCYKAQLTKTRCITHGHSANGKTSKTYRAWEHLKSRCNNPNDEKYSDYGKRGIRFCPRWDKYENFLADMGEAPEGTSIDRIDNNGNYEPSNCRWATTKEQARNKRTSRIIIYLGKSQCLAAWAEEYNMPMKEVHSRFVKRQWSIERALTQPLRRKAA